MSRGPGSIQTGILELLRGYDPAGDFWSVLALARALCGSASPAALSSVRRALRELSHKGLVTPLPRRHARFGDNGLRWELTENKRKREGARHDPTPPPPDPARAKLAKTLGLLGSSHDGEVLAAARAAERQRLEIGLGWDALLDAMELPARPPMGGR
jgi:hypothetical protein